MKAGTWRQELLQKLYRNAAYWLAPCGFPSLFSYTTQNHLYVDGGSTAHSTLGLSTTSSKQMNHNLPTGLLVGAFSQLRLLLIKEL